MNKTIKYREQISEPGIQCSIYCNLCVDLEIIHHIIQTRSRTYKLHAYTNKYKIMHAYIHYCCLVRIATGGRGQGVQHPRESIIIIIVVDIETEPSEDS